MGVVYSVRFMAITGLAGGAVYTVPTGNVAVVRDIDVFYVNGLAGADFHAYQPPYGCTYAFLSWAALDPSSVKSWRGRQVFLAGEDISVATTGALDVSVCGYLLQTP